LLKGVVQRNERCVFGKILKASNANKPTMRRAKSHFYILT